MQPFYAVEASNGSNWEKRENKKMKKLILSIIAVALSAMSVSASKWGVMCQVNDSTGQGEPYATVRIVAATDTSRVLKTGVTEADGRFHQDLDSAGRYVLSVTAVGKVSEEREFSLSEAKPMASLGEIVLHEQGTLLQGVTVTSLRPLVKNEIDRLSYDVQGDADSRTNSVLEMLRKVPLVTVDGQDNVKVKGSTNFKIYKNGHPDAGISQNPKEVLKAIPASTIKRIEVITEPGAKYDAEGVSAILNIITVNNVSLSGVLGSVNAGINHNGSVNMGGYITWQMGKVVTNVSYGNHLINSRENRSTSHNETTFVESGNKRVEDATNKGDVNVHYGNIEASYEPDSLNLFTLSFGGYAYNLKYNVMGSSAMNDANGNQLYSYDYEAIVGHPRNSYLNFNGRFDYQHRTRVKDETITLSYMLSTTGNKNNARNSYFNEVNMPVSYNGYRQTGDERFMEHTLQLDWTRPFAKYNKIETGVKYIHRKNKSTTTMDYDDDSDGVDSRFNHLTQVAAAYAMYTYSNGNLSARAGMRYEYSYLSARYPDGSQADYHRHLSDWVPSASLNYQINPANSLKWAFATRINRPGITYLNPAVISSPTSVSYGNSHLSSARTYSTSMTYMHIGRKLTFNIVPGFNFSNNQISNVETADGNRTVSTYDNALHTKWVGVGGYAQWQIHEKSSLMVNADAGWNYFRSDAVGIKASGWAYSLWCQFTQRLPWDIRLSAHGGLWKSELDLYGHNDAMGWYGFDLQKTFLKENRLTVRLSATRPFSGKYQTWTNYIDRGDYTSVSRNANQTRRFSISISYRFGSLRASVKKTNKTIDNSDMVGGSKAAAENQ